MIGIERNLPDPCTLTAQALAGAPRIGTALPVVQHGTRSLPREIPLPAAGAWVKLRNLAATLVNGQLQVSVWPQCN